MSGPLPPYLFKNRFQEVLSGEFRPPQDPSKRSWRLNELAQLAILEGQYATASTDKIIEEGRISFFYTPTWAPNIDADVFGDMLDGIAVIDSLFYSESVGKLAGEELIVSMIGDSVVKLGESEYEITTESSLAIAKAAITHAAQAFFEQTSKD